jgi:hypothetical protein
VVGAGAAAVYVLEPDEDELVDELVEAVVFFFL